MSDVYRRPRARRRTSLGFSLGFSLLEVDDGLKNAGVEDLGFSF